MNKTIIAATMLVSAALSTKVCALESDWLSDGYLKASLGTSEYDMSSDSQGIPLNFDQGTAFSIVGGVRLAKYLSVEAGYYTFGEVSDSIYQQRGTLEVDGVESELEQDIDMTLSSFGSALRVHSDTDATLYVGALLGYQRWDSEESGVLRTELQHYRYDPVNNTREVEIITGGGQFNRDDSGSGWYGGVFTGWQSPLGEIGLEYAIFDVYGNKPTIFAGTYTYRF